MPHHDPEGVRCTSLMADEGNGTTAYCWDCGAVASHRNDTGRLEGHGSPREAL